MGGVNESTANIADGRQACLGTQCSTGRGAIIELRRWRDQLSVKSPRQADYTWSIMSAVFKHGILYGEISTNPCALGGKLYDGSCVEVIWTSPQVGAFLH